MSTPCLSSNSALSDSPTMIPPALWSTMLGIPDWVFWWGFVAVAAAFFFLFCSLWLFWTESSWKDHVKCFFCALTCFLPCLWCPVCCCFLCCSDQKPKCKLCGEELLGDLGDLGIHLEQCRQNPAYGEIPDSPLYHCQKCDTHLKVWPADKIESMDCASLECSEEVKNNGSNIHLCFTCDRMVCDKHNSNPGQRINIDMSNPESVRLAINDRVNEDPGSILNDTGGFPDQRRSSISPFPDLPRTSPFPPTVPSSFPVPPRQSNSSSYNLSSRPYTRPTDVIYSTDLLQPGHQMPNAYTTNGSNVISHNTFNSTYQHQACHSMPNPYTTDGSNLSSLNTYNLNQNTEDVFPDLPPSYEVAMMDETNVY